MIKAEIIADSLNPVGNRLTTWVLEFPRFVLAEFATHRMFSKNAASSRAIPIEKMIEQVMTNPAMPVWWGKNQSGMQAKEELDDTLGAHRIWEGQESYLVTSKEMAKKQWLDARDHAIYQVRKLMEIGLHKQIANRLLEPWFNIRIIMSATEMDNFFALRAHEDAQPEIRALAYKMLEEYNKSQPKRLKAGEWHIPFGDKIDSDRLESLIEIPADWEYPNQRLEDIVSAQLNVLKIKIAIARCARISYLNFEGKDDYLADIKLCDRLFGSTPRHLSPTEHVAQAMEDSSFVGNFKGFKQYRYLFDDQNLTDQRVIKHVN